MFVLLFEKGLIAFFNSIGYFLNGLRVYLIKEIESFTVLDLC